MTWDFYPCRVDDAPASIWLDLRYERTAPPTGAVHLYWIRIAMADVADDGMGSAAPTRGVRRRIAVLRRSARRRRRR